MSTTELCGVALRDVYRDKNGDLWEVIGLCDKPQATFRRVKTGDQTEHVIGCLNMREQFPNGPLRGGVEDTADGAAVRFWRDLYIDDVCPDPESLAKIDAASRVTRSLGACLRCGKLRRVSAGLCSRCERAA